MEKRKARTTIYVIALVAVLVVANAFLGYSLAQESERAMTEQIQARMVDTARIAADLLDGDSLESLTAEDAGTPAYEQVMKTLSSFQEGAELSYVYCLRQVGDKSFEFTIDSSVDNPAEFGEPVVYTDALARAAEGNPSVDLVPYEDRWGRFYSAYCPVFNSKGKVAGIVGVDFDADWYENHIAFIGQAAMVSCIVSFILALIAIIMVARMSRAEAKHERNLQDANRFDALTGLPNMGYFLELAKDNYEVLKAKGQEPVMLYMDLVDMKDFNNKWGFAEGDNLLKAFAELLAKYFGHELCSRFGQDHFAVSTNGEDLDSRLDAFIEEAAGINGGKSVPVCIGVYPEMLGRADASVAADRAKAACDEGSGALQSNYTYFSIDMLERAELRKYFIDNLDRAIAEGWIRVHYQPIVRASTGKVCDEEALARWVDPERGSFSPADFIPVLEDAKLVHKLDLCVLEQTLEKMNHMAEAGLHVVPASVNLSRIDFQVCDIVEEVRKRVDEAGVERGKITLEITESALGLDFEFMKEQVERFHELGFQVWMDDFGSEYSSLDYLQSLRFDLLKLDMRFMQQFDQGDKGKIILTELVKMAMGLGIDTVAEGVETNVQVGFLREVGCSKLQGFFFTEPHPVEEVLQRYEDGTAIGFENPAEAEYYAALGSVNLYDLSSVMLGNVDGFKHYFDTLPMAVVETTDEEFAIMRCNKSYLDFIQRIVGEGRVAERVSFEFAESGGPSKFVEVIRECGKQGGKATIDEVMPGGFATHAFVRRIAVNPVSGAAAVAVAVLAVFKDEEER